jgi:hypothetical protein
VILAEERTTEEEKQHILEARRRAAAKKKKLKNLGKNASTDTDDDLDDQGKKSTVARWLNFRPNNSQTGLCRETAAFVHL